MFVMIGLQLNNIDSFNSFIDGSDGSPLIKIISGKNIGTNILNSLLLPDEKYGGNLNESGVIKVISIDNKLDGLDARVAILESSDGNTDQNTEWLEGKVKKKIKNIGREHLRLFFLQYHQRQRGL